MPRALFEKNGNAVYISHLDLMRVFQRAFKRAGLALTHTQGYSPRPSVSIALPLSVGVESDCELLDFDLDGCDISLGQIRDQLNAVLIEGVKIREIYEEGSKIKNIAFLDCVVSLEYDAGIPQDAAERIQALFKTDALTVEKTGKNGTVQQDIIPMIRNFCVEQADANTLCLTARICCQNPSLNPNLIVSAIEVYLPELKPDFARCKRLEVYNQNDEIFR